MKFLAYAIEVTRMKMLNLELKYIKKELLPLVYNSDCIAGNSKLSSNFMQVTASLITDSPADAHSENYKYSFYISLHK